MKWILITLILFILLTPLMTSAYSLHIIVIGGNAEFMVFNGSKTLIVIGNTTLNGLYGNVTVLAMSESFGYNVVPSRVTLNMSENTSLEFFIVPSQVYIKVGAIGDGFIIIRLPNGTIINGSNIMVKVPYYSVIDVFAQPSHNYTLVGWSGGLTNKEITLTALGNTSLTATFAPLNGVRNDGNSLFSRGFTTVFASILLLIAMIILMRTKGSSQEPT